MIVRTIRKDKFTPICNELLCDFSITFRAKGLLCYLISRPPNWNVNVSHLCKNFKEGRDAVYTTIKELIEAGYIKRVQLKNEQGRHIGMEYHVFETKEVPQTPFQEVISQQGENPAINKDGSLITTEKNKEPVEPAAKKIEKLELTMNQRKIAFLKIIIDFVAVNPKKYPKLLYLDFAKYWVEKSLMKKKEILRFEEQRFFDISRRLSTWSIKVNNSTLSDYWNKDEQLETLNELFKKQILNINNGNQ